MKHHPFVGTILGMSLLTGIAFGQERHAPSSQIRVDGPILGGDGSANYIPIWRTNSYLLSSVIYQTNGSIGIGTTAPQATLDVNGAINSQNTYAIGENNVLSIGGEAFYGNLFVGPFAGSNDITEQGKWNTFLGNSSGLNTTTGTANTFTGYESGVNNLTGAGNSFYGAFAGSANTMGTGNTFLGNDAGGVNTSGSANTFVGQQTGAYSTEGYNNIFVGYNAGFYNSTGSSDIYIGNAGPQTGNESSTIRIGTQGTSLGQQSTIYVAGVYGTAVSGVPVYVNANGQLGVQTSSQRFKQDIADMGDSTSQLMRLRPVTFVYKPEYANGDGSMQYGLIAEEVAKIYPQLVAYDSDGNPYSVRYQYLSTMLLNEVQKQYRRAETEEVVIQAQEQRISDLEGRRSRLEKIISQQAVAQK